MDLMSNKGLGLRPRSWWIVSLISLTLLASLPPVSKANHDAKRLYDDLLRKNNYNKLIRPVGNSSEGLTVRLGLRLAQLIDVDERNEIITLNMWVIQEWEDYSLRWDPKEYGGVDMIYVPSKSIWLPDIVLYNNADGDYTVTLMTKATLNHFGKVVWEPPAIYKSHCDINVEFFPFDEQLCQLKFGSWTYDGTSVDLRHIWADELDIDELDVIELAMDIKNYYRSVEWDLIAVPAKKNNKYYPCCSEPYPDITFNITLRRKTLFYTINLLLPCVFINMITVLVFYLPSDSGEKISLCISILLSLSVFQLLLMEMIPATSLTIPLMGRYILFTMIMVSVSVFISVVTLNVNFRGSTTHVMPSITRTIFLGILPRLLFMKRPLDDEEPTADDPEWCNWPEAPSRTEARRRSKPSEQQQASGAEAGESVFGNVAVSSSFVGAQSLWKNTDLSNFCNACANRKLQTYPTNAYKAMEGVIYVAKHLKHDDAGTRVKDDWRYTALVIDRLLLWIYVSVCVVGSTTMLLRAPMHFDTRRPIQDTVLGTTE